MCLFVVKYSNLATVRNKFVAIKNGVCLGFLYAVVNVRMRSDTEEQNFLVEWLVFCPVLGILQVHFPDSQSDCTEMS